MFLERFMIRIEVSVCWNARKVLTAGTALGWELFAGITARFDFGPVW